jgi:hypothetical protein
MRIRRQEVSRLQEASDSLLVFQANTPDPRHALHVPMDLDEYQEITKVLFGWCPPTARSPRTVTASVGIWLLMLLGMVLLLLAPEPWLTILGGVCLLIVNFYFVWPVGSNPKNESKTRQNFLYITGVVILATLFRLYTLTAVLRSK